MTPAEQELERRLLRELWLECLPWYRRAVYRLFGH